jgi:hypothetical protein
LRRGTASGELGQVGHFKRLSLGAGAIAAALVGALSGVTHVAAGSNGQQFMYINGFFVPPQEVRQICVHGNNQQGIHKDGCWTVNGATYTETTGWWWTGTIYFNSQDWNGNWSGNIYINIPTSQSANCWSFENDNGHQGPYYC